MSTKLLKSVIAAIAVLGASVGFATDYTLTQSGKWSDPATWGLTEGYPNTTSDTITIPDTIAEAVTIDLDGGSFAIKDITNNSAQLVTFKNGTITGPKPGEDNGGELYLKKAGGGFGFEGGVTLGAGRIWAFNGFVGASTFTFKDGVNDFTLGRWGFSSTSTSSTLTINCENAILRNNNKVTQVNSLSFNITFNVKLGENNVDGGEAAIQFLGYGYSANGGTRTLTVDCEGKTVGKYAIIKDANAKDSTRISALAESATVNNLGSGLAAAFSWDSTDKTIYLTLTEGGGEQRALNTFVVNEGGDWNNANTWFHNPSQTYPNSTSHTAYVTPESEKDAIVTVSSATLGGVQANSLVVSNDCAVTFKGTVSGAIFRFLAAADTTGASGFLIQKGAKVTLDSVQCGNNYNTFYTWLNGDAELALVGNATLGGYLIRPNGNATDGYPTLSFKDGAAKWLLASGAFNSATALTFKFDNATLTSNKGFNMLASKATWNIKMGANNTTDTAVFTATSGDVQSSTRPAFVIDMTGKKSGTYPIISAQLGGQYQQVTNSDFTVTCDVKCHFSVITDKDTGISLNFEKAQGLVFIVR